MKARIAAGLVLAMAWWCADAARAAPVRVDFAGSVQGISGQHRDDPNSGVSTPISPAEAEAALGGSIHVGTRFSGWLMYDDSALPHDGNAEGGPFPYPLPAWNQYWFPSPYFPGPGIGWPAAVHGEIGSFIAEGSVDTGAAFIAEVWDNELDLDGASPSRIYLGANVLDGPQVGGGPIVLWGIELDAFGAGPGAPLHGTSLVSLPWDLESFPSTSAGWLFSDGLTSVRVTGTVDQLSSVPEPACACLVALAACAMWVARRELSKA